MATAAQIAANRRNAKRSTGPRSLEGKRKSSQNARRQDTPVPVPDDVVAQFVEVISESLPPRAREEPLRSIYDLAQAEARRLCVTVSAEETLEVLSKPDPEQEELASLMRDFLAQGIWRPVFNLSLAHLRLTNVNRRTRNRAKHTLTKAELEVSRSRRALVDRLCSQNEPNFHL